MVDNRQKISHWWRQILEQDGDQPLRASLNADREADVCIVGAGYTGLWTAYELLRGDPQLSVVLLDAEVAGYGASGRNGGAVIAQLNGSREFWTKRGGREGAIAMERAAQQAVVCIGEAVQREGIDCSYSANGVLMAARNELEANHFRHTVEEDRLWGFGPEDSRYLSKDELEERVHVDGAIGARFSPHCASIHPGRLVRGLAQAVERLGAVIYEQTRVTSISPHLATTGAGGVTAKYVLRATEAYTETIPTESRQIIPVYTSMIVTDPISEAILSEIGWAGREALLAEHPFLHLQHTADHRITIGGDDNRVPYRYGSAPSPDGPPPERVSRTYHRELVKLFPPLADVTIGQAWQGVFGTNRIWAPSVSLDQTTGLGAAGGYVGEGVAISNLAGRTLADLVLGRDSELTRLPWVGLSARRWEPEPLRYLGAQLIWSMRTLGDVSERRTGKASPLFPLGNRLAGFTGHLG
ncbi:MAG: NAD(P)/FAD-dependent oxidoreductase [Acidimicrobiales bacterium]